ncbi:MAG: pantetheine-phosphate adenylyltransferase [Prevotella conceptionensis]|jgi:pantetheine-phosphate adenylyltransferase
MKTGLFTGSFDPFTIGHQSIVARVLPLFDKIVIGVGVNERKKYMYSAEVRVKEIAELYADNPKVEVRAFNDLAVDFAHREGAWFFVKGVRSVKDFEYEREQADVNRMMGGIETLLVFAEPQHASVSSSLVRELIHFGKNAEMFLPKRKNKK